MKVLLGVVLLVGFGWVAWHVVNMTVETRICYMTSIGHYDEIAFRAGREAWGTRRVCENKFDAYEALRQCLAKVETSRPPWLVVQIRPTVESLVRMLRPGLKELPARKTEHNTDCAEYPALLIEE